MGRKIKIIDLSNEDKEYLEKHVKHGSSRAVEHSRCRILLLNAGGLSTQKISELLNWSYSGVSAILRTYEEHGLESALFDAPRCGAPRKVTAEIEAKVTAIACSAAPDGRVRWTMQLLADEVVRLKYIESISHTSIHTVIKKVNSSLGKKKCGV